MTPHEEIAQFQAGQVDRNQRGSRLTDAIIALGSTLPEDDRRAWLSELYWRNSDTARVIGYAAHYLVELAIDGSFRPLPRAFEAWCRLCKTDYLRMCTSWDNEELMFLGELPCIACASEITRRLKALPYDEYLRTRHWQQQRDLALRAAADCCQLCNADKGLDVHHRTYARLGRERPADLIVLCRACHTRHHAQA